MHSGAILPAKRHSGSSGHCPRPVRIPIPTRLAGWSTVSVIIPLPAEGCTPAGYSSPAAGRPGSPVFSLEVRFGTFDLDAHRACESYRARFFDPNTHLADSRFFQAQLGQILGERLNREACGFFSVGLGQFGNRAVIHPI